LLDYLHSLNRNTKVKGRMEEREEEKKEKKVANGEGEGEGEDPVRTREFYRFVSEIVSGMRALEAKHIQHRDLAARNIFLTSRREVKIGDFGLSRAEGSNFTFGLISTRWTAPEVLESEANFTLRSDVWSFGVVMWEIYSLGSLPYSDVPIRELLPYLSSGRRLIPPSSAPSNIAKLMRMCWEMPAESRPTFVKLDFYLNGRSMRSESGAYDTRPPILPIKPQLSSTSVSISSASAAHASWSASTKKHNSLILHKT
uniref:Protein kinase domain-containing protein n=1 Tax=Hydatigena taeniaeformis TaxID=6205 RepID=A0A0R3WUM2_HYDTA